jgi:hypothetical protein
MKGETRVAQRWWGPAGWYAPSYIESKVDLGFRLVDRSRQGFAEAHRTRLPRSAQNEFHAEAEKVTPPTSRVLSAAHAACRALNKSGAKGEVCTGPHARNVAVFFAVLRLLQGFVMSPRVMRRGRTGRAQGRAEQELESGVEPRLLILRAAWSSLPGPADFSLATVRPEQQRREKRNEGDKSCTEQRREWQPECTRRGRDY